MHHFCSVIKPVNERAGLLTTALRIISPSKPFTHVFRKSKQAPRTDCKDYTKCVGSSRS